MTFNSSQQERLLAALERIADALEKQAPPPPVQLPDRIHHISVGPGEDATEAAKRFYYLHREGPDV